MRLRLVLSLLSSLWIAALASADAPDPAAELELNLTGNIEIAADGSVHAVQIDSAVKPSLAELVERKVRDWRFEPVSVDGRPVIAKTRLRLSLRAVPHAGDYRLQIDDVGFGEPVASDLQPPRYPREAMRAGIGAKVLLAVRLDEHGRVVEAYPYQTSLDRSMGDLPAKKWRTQFERASLTAVKTWRYDLTEFVGGQVMSQTAIVPITFQVGTPSSRPVWRQHVPGPVTPAPWSGDERVAAQYGDLADGEARSLSSRFRLKDDLQGAWL